MYSKMISCRSSQPGILKQKLISFYKKLKYINTSGNCLLSHPKSGRTWLQAILSYAVFLEYKLNDPEYFFYLHPQLSLNIPRLVFTHGGSEVISRNSDLSAFHDKAVVFLIRDLRDVQTSYFYHVSYRYQNFSGTLSQCLRHENYGIQKIIRYHNAVYRARNTYAKFIIVRYEDMKINCFPVIEKCLKFYKIKVSTRNIVKAIKWCAFEQMRQREKSGSSNHPALLPVNKANENSFKVRKGKQGGYKEDMSINDIAYCNQIIAQQLDPDLNKVFTWNP